MNKMAYMYILKCANGSFYTGSTVDIARRLQEHQNGEGAHHTKRYGPVELVYFEEFSQIKEAFEREHQIKKWTRKKKIDLIEGKIGKTK